MDSEIDTPVPNLRTPSNPRASASCARSRGRPQALIVDDCRFIAVRLARMLEHYAGHLAGHLVGGFECTLAGDGYVALELIRARRFQLFVLAVDLPFVDGFSVLRQLRVDPIHAATPVLMLTSDAKRIGGVGPDAPEDDHARALELGASACSSKPLQLRPLADLLATILDPI